MGMLCIALLNQTLLYPGADVPPFLCGVPQAAFDLAPA
jgi:hypothetical protein